MADLKDYYKVLGVKDSASAADVKRAYRELARSHHPDRNPGDPRAEEMFKAVQEAYGVLSDAERRKKYDQRRRSRASGRRFSTRNGTTYRSDAGDTYVRQTPPRAKKPSEPSPADEEKLFKGLGGLFKNVFAPGEGREGRASLDAHKTIRIAFEDAVQGGKTEVETPRGGRVRVRIPRGVRSGFKIRVGGEGHQSEGRTGDLFVTFDVAPHATFDREGLDLAMSLKISAFEAILGTVRTVTDAYGKQVKLAVPPGTQPGERLRLRDMGIQTDDNVGDLYVEIELTIPRNLTHEQRELLRRAASGAGLMES